MNTKGLREIGKWLMICGGTLLTAGFGVNVTCNFIDKSEAKAAHAKNVLLLDEENMKQKALLEEEALMAKAESDRLYSERLGTMDQKAFAKFHAESVAAANESVMAKAEEIRKISEATVVSTRMECTDKINSIRSECLRKIEEANRQRDEAMAKYEAIDILFTNKNEILKAKKALEAAVKSDQKAKDNKEELLKSIQDILK